MEAAAAAADHLSSTGAAAVVFTVQEGTEPSLLRSCLQQVRARPFGVRVAAGADPALLVAARDEGATDFVSCLAGKAAPRPSAVLQALGVRPPDANFGTLFLAEHVPNQRRVSERARCSRRPFARGRNGWVVGPRVTGSLNT